MSTMTVQEAQANLATIIDHLKPGESLVLTSNAKPVARLTSESAPTQKQRRLGTLRGTVLSMAPDFNAPLEEFREYME